MNNDPIVKVLMLARVNGKQANDLICKAAFNFLENGTPIDIVFADLFKVEIKEREDGSKYAVVDFA